MSRENGSATKTLQQEILLVVETKTSPQCFNCSRPETEVPLINLRYAGSQGWICPQCLPTLIHQPQNLVGKVVGTEKLIPMIPDE